MLCSLCNSKTRVVGTRDSAVNPNDNNIPARYRQLFPGPYVYRKHVCESCNNMFETLEIDVDEVIKLARTTRQDVISKVMDLLVRL